MQRLFIFVLITRGFLTSAIHARTSVDSTVKNSTQQFQELQQQGASRGLVANADGTWSLDGSKLSPMSITNDLALGYCMRQPGTKWIPAAQDAEYFTIRHGHKKYLDTKPNTGCEECMELAAWLIQEGDDGRVCEDLKNNTSPCMKARTLTLSEVQFNKNPENYLNFQLTCRCAIKYQCDIIAVEPLQWLGTWELDKMLHGRDYAKVAGMMEDTIGKQEKQADFSPTVGWHEDKSGPNANTMYGIGGLTGERNNAKDLAKADINSGVESRDLMRDSGMYATAPDTAEINSVTGESYSPNFGFLQIHTESNEKPVV